MINRGSFAVIISILLSACNADNKSAIQTEIEANNARLCRWYLSGYCDSIAQLYTADAYLKNPNEAPLQGRDAIKQNWINRCSQGLWYYKMTTNNVTISIPVVIERGTYSIRFFPGVNAPPHVEAFTETGTYLTQWQLQDGQWLIANTINSKELTMK